MLDEMSLRIPVMVRDWRPATITAIRRDLDITGASIAIPPRVQVGCGPGGIAIYASGTVDLARASRGKKKSRQAQRKSSDYFTFFLLGAARYGTMVGRGESVGVGLSLSRALEEVSPPNFFASDFEMTGGARGRAHAHARGIGGHPKRPGRNLLEIGEDKPTATNFQAGPGSSPGAAPGASPCR